MLKLIICGINGAMGSKIYEQAIACGHEITCGIDKITVKNVDCQVFTDFDQIPHFANVIVDFSSPSITSDLLNYALSNSLPLVIGTTGHSKLQEEQIYKASKSIPIFKSANTSLGVFSFVKLCKLASQLLNDYDLQIVEKHHKNKKDSPSGTANLIYKELLGTAKTINLHSIRGGTVVGEHEVMFLGNGESITLTHKAESKLLFANGALKACEFIANKQSGLYSTKDLI